MTFHARAQRPCSTRSGRAYRSPPVAPDLSESLPAKESSTVTRTMEIRAEESGGIGNFSGDWPAVSVVMAVLNEERHLAEAVGAILRQDYPAELELVIALGPSRDRTDEIAEKLAAE